MINKRKLDFENLINGKSDSFDFQKSDEILKSIQSEFGNKSVNELLTQEKRLIKLAETGQKITL